jgi:ubiquinone/menaquinone biosynthesis C-methylase UbiE
MRRVDYDDVASTYNRRYERNRYDGTRAALYEFLGDAANADVAEVGCGTGHWLADVAGSVRTIIGIDASWEMLRCAAADAPSALLIHARAEQLPLATASVDRVFCVNALHHFSDLPTFASEARRVLRSGGSLMSVGLDPHTALDRWWIYDYFPAALAADRSRYLPTQTIRDIFEDAGLADVHTNLAQHIPAAVPFQLAVERGYIDRRSTSQLLVISDAEYEDGLERMRQEQPVLRADLRLFATVGRV